MQPDFDDDFNSTVSDIPITSFKDLINQYSTQHDADNNSVGSNIENITPNASAYDIVQSVQILVDQVAKGAWGMLDYFLVSHISKCHVLLLFLALLYY